MTKITLVANTYPWILESRNEIIFLRKQAIPLKKKNAILNKQGPA